jgi:uncharacterized membrane protein (UPF0127 family)
VPRKQIAVITLVVALCVIGAGMYYYFAVMRSGGSAASTSTLQLGSSAAGTYNLETVSDEQSQARGLSGRSSLAAGTGMRFAYKGMDRRCMWMKDMKFNIDMVWLDSNHRIISAVQNVSPSTYPHTYCAVASDVIELPAGALRSSGARVGQIVKL